MRQRYLTEQGNSDLIIFVLGWGAIPQSVEHIRPIGYDVLCVWDYRDGDFSLFPDQLWNNYQNHYLFAWSFGVKISEIIFSGRDFTRAVALNGTPAAVNERYGIEPRRFALTVDALLRGGTDKFAQRTYGAAYEHLNEYLFTESLQSYIDELRLLGELPQGEPIVWHKAIVGSHDLIFPPENMLRFWEEFAKTETEILPLPHFPFAETEVVLKELRTIGEQYRT